MICLRSPNTGTRRFNPSSHKSISTRRSRSSDVLSGEAVEEEAYAEAPAPEGDEATEEEILEAYEDTDGMTDEEALAELEAMARQEAA